MHLENKRKEIFLETEKKLPFIIRKFCGSWKSELGFNPVELNQVYFPEYVFSYTAPGGNSSDRLVIVFDIKRLNDFIVYLAEEISIKKSAKFQRALMTTKLRNEILKRDYYTCQECKISIFQEPHLLLEVDHKTPISKGGETTPENLQTLCWKCNRRKGNKI